MKVSYRYRLCACLIALSMVAVTGCDKSEAAAEDTTATAQQAATVQEEAAPEAQSPEAEAENAEQETPKTAVVGQLAPDFELADETGKTHKLSDYRGKIVVLEWFNIPCPYVRRHYAAGTFDTTIEAAGGLEEVVWLAVDTTHNNTPEDTKKWKEATERRHDYPVLQDPSGEVGRMYEAKTTPHMYVIDKEGIIRYIGAIDDDPRGRVEEPTNYVIQALAALKEGKDVDPSTTTPYGCTVKYN